MQIAPGVKGGMAAALRQPGAVAGEPQEDEILGAADMIGGRMGPQRRYLRVSDAADLMRVTKRTIRNMIEDGRLRASRFGSVVLIQTYDLLDALEPIQPKKQRTQNGSSQESQDGNGSGAEE